MTIAGSFLAPGRPSQMLSDRNLFLAFLASWRFYSGFRGLTIDTTGRIRIISLEKRQGRIAGFPCVVSGNGGDADGPRRGAFERRNKERNVES